MGASATPSWETPRTAAVGDRDACEVTVCGADGRETVFTARKNELLLRAAVGHGLDYPHNCRVGVCGTCKTRVVSGRVSPMVDPALSPLTNAEIRDGYVLACQAKIRTDLRVEKQLGTQPLLPVTTVSARVVGSTRLPGEVIDLRLRLDAPIRFRAGQYCALAESGSFTRRSYSFYDTPPAEHGSGVSEVGFLVKRLPGGRFSEWLFAADRLDTKFWIEGPFGGAPADDADRDGLCVAGGTGLAPVLSIVGEGLRRSATARFTIVFAVRTQQDVFANQRLVEILSEARDRVRLITILSREPEGSRWAGLRGPVTDALGSRLELDFPQIRAAVCGSQGMVEAVEARLIRLGVKADRIHSDKFVPSGTP